MVKTYRPQDVIYIFAASEIGGFANGTFLSVARNNDSATYEPGGKGSGTRTLTADRSGRVTSTLQQTSPSNAVFSAQLTAMELDGGGISSFLIKENGGDDLHEGATSWVVRRSDAEYATETSNREWIVETDELLGVIGGQA